MISDMRKHFQSPLYKAGVWVAIVALAGVFSIPTLIKEVNSEPWAIKVNDVEVGVKQFNWALTEKREWLGMVRAQYGPQTDMLLQAFGIKPDPVSLAMESMINESLITDLAHNIPLYLHNQSVQEQLANPEFIKYYLSALIPSFVLQKDGSINESMLRNFLSHKGMKPSEFERSIEQAIERKIVMDIFSVGSYVPLFDKNATYALNQSKRSFDILTFSYENQLKIEKQQPLSQEEIASYYALKKGSSQYQIPEKRAGIVWKFNAHEYGIDLSKAEIESYYEAHKAQLYTKSPKKIEVRTLLIKDDQDDAQERAQALCQQLIDNPASFAQKAREFSQDEETASSGGRVDPFARGDKEVAFEKAAFLLKNDGDISSVVKTGRGYEIIQRIKIINPVYDELSQVLPQIKASLLRNKFSNQFATDCKNLKIKFKKSKNDFDSFVQEKNGTESDLSLSALEESLVSKTLFGIKGIDSIDICIDKDVAYIVQLTNLTKAYTADLSEVKDAVTESIYQSRAAEGLKKIAQEALQVAGRADRLDSLKKDFGGSLVSVHGLSSEDISKSDSLKKLEIDASVLSVLEYDGLARLVVNDQGAHIIKVTARSEGNVSKEGTLDEMRQINDRRKRLMSDSFVASLYRNATIKTNESMNKIQQNYSL
jgi:parvulin-like peptidyl-prolyl isomerase/uncharacterized protein YneF (UPF0154 family)